MRPLERLVDSRLGQLVTNPLGVFVNTVSDALNENPQHRAAAMILRRMGHSRYWRLRKEAAWVIEEQVQPSRDQTELLWALLRDQHPRVFSRAVLGVIQHAPHFSRPQLEAGLKLLREAKTEGWVFPGGNEAAKRRLISEMESELNDEG